MRNLKIIILAGGLLGVALLAAGCGSTDAVPTDTGGGDDNPYSAHRVGTDSTLEVMTWNIQNFAKQGAVTAQHVIDAVEGLDVDIVALQEIESLLYFQQVREGLENWAGDRATSAYKDVNLAFLYRIDGEVQVNAAYEILTAFRTELPRSPFVLEGTIGGTEFVVINNHYKCCGDNVIDESDSWDEENRRLRASRLLEDFIRANYEGKAVIVVGDFNDELTDAPASNVFQPFLDAPEAYRFVDLAIAEGNPQQVLWSYPTWPSHLDHILISDELFGPVGEAGTALVEVVPLHDYSGGWSKYQAEVSDHLPVLLRVAP